MSEVSQVGEAQSKSISNTVIIVAIIAIAVIVLACITACTVTSYVFLANAPWKLP